MNSMLTYGFCTHSSGHKRMQFSPAVHYAFDRRGPMWSDSAANVCLITECFDMQEQLLSRLSKATSSDTRLLMQWRVHLRKH